jgi:3-oxoacid CoA-transferase subunit B
MPWLDEEIYKITAREEFKEGLYINLGIGMPTLVANYTPKDIHVTLHTENGMLGVGPFPLQADVDADLINAGKQTISALPNSSFFNSADSFAMARGGHLDLTILGAFQVSENADLANWSIPGKIIKGMGGAMDLVNGVKRVVILMSHTAKDGVPKIVKQCSYPLTGKNVVDRIITELGIFDFIDGKLHLTKIAPGTTLQEIKNQTEASFITSIK